jgi:short-subunit dehydrogenase
LVFGATSAIAQAVLRRLVAQGASVYCIGRNGPRLAAVLADLRVRAAPDRIVDGQTADLLDTDTHSSLFTSAEARIGELDAVLIAHGTRPDQAACAASTERTLAAIAENGTSAVSLLTIAANYFDPKGRGVIAAISSVAGDRGRQSNYAYGASKSLVSTFLQGLRNRLAARGVSVLTVKPGFVDTPMTADINPKGILWSTPDVVARDIVRAMKRGADVIYTPWYWYWIMLVLRHLPEALFKRMRL